MMTPLQLQVQVSSLSDYYGIPRIHHEPALCHLYLACGLLPHCVQSFLSWGACCLLPDHPCCLCGFCTADCSLCPLWTLLGCHHLLLTDSDSVRFHGPCKLRWLPAVSEFCFEIVFFSHGIVMDSNHHSVTDDCLQEEATVDKVSHQQYRM